MLLNNFSNWIIKASSKGGLIAEKDEEIYLFGIETALLKLIHFSTMLIIGLCAGKLLETFVFIVSYSTLRVYAGGYHAKTRLRCYGISWLLILFVLLFTEFCPNQIAFVVSILVSLPSYFIIFLLAPVDNINKPLDDTEIHHYKIKARIVLSVELIISMIFLFTYLIQISLIVSLSIFSVAIMLVVGKT
ncbi:accessory gene regulator ArgB-like protein [Caproiciproducens sp.]|uniref:accessory gene regulator ArgB-like protein n=1 Tax=Caproiciproducens sp. TaxID=1954376 RepID=UPI00289F3DC7|nr:accessory gene regulator B family protein [Caproiciproducens sp.]